ncbi:hypothetical protein FRC05_009823 [Tulasnella sp. 425]|nr:hypothetical protein FRC05_009823 [Tulasnella sp. 425]
MDHPPFDDKRTETAIDPSHTRRLPIDTLPTELLERVIRLGATGFLSRGPELKWICEWRRVCWKWASIIDHCSALWSYIVVSNGTGHVQTQLERSKEALLIIETGYLDDKEEWMQLLVNNVHRSLCDAVLPTLDAEALKIYDIGIPPDSRFFNPPSPNLRVLELDGVTIPCKIQPIIGLEELHLFRICEALEDGIIAPISVRKVHQFLQANPGLHVLRLTGGCTVSAADTSLQPVDLPNLEMLVVHGPIVLHLFRAEHCASLTVTLDPVQEKLPPAAWTTVVATLRRAKGLEVVVSTYSLSITSLIKPPTITLRLDIEPEEDAGHLSYAILEDILQKLENESCISAPIQLAFSANDDIGVKVLKLLQSPMPGPSSRWRLPQLDRVRIRGEGFPYRYLQAFVQARANAQGDQAPKAITSILVMTYSSESKEILGEVLSYVLHERDAENGVV